MTTCTWSFRRHAARLGVSAALVVGVSGLVASPASADQLSSLKAEAQSVANQIQTLGNQEDSLSEQYDSANLALQKDQKDVAAATAAVAAANTKVKTAKGALRADAINAYIHGGTSGAPNDDNSLGNANSSLLRAEYVSTLAANQSDDEDRYRLASVEEQTAKQNLEAAQAAAQKQVDTLAADRQQVMDSENKLKVVYQQETTQIATLVAQIQAQQEAAAAAAARAKAAAEAAAQRAAAQQAAEQAQQQRAASQQAVETAASSASPSQSDPATSPSPSSGAPAPQAPAQPTVSVPAASGVGAAAVAAAETQLGVPYVWGGASPRGSASPGFDCSGLVMWAYAQVGISLPHYSGAQFSAGVQIPMSDLEPGDLVFFSDPGEHVAMYIGGGQIIEAPSTGQVVHIVPLYPEFVLAVRIS